MRLLLIVAVVCLTIALLGAASVLGGVNVDAWFIGGMLAWCVSSATGDYLLPIGRRAP